MGNLLRALSRGPDDNVNSVFVDFENCQPSAEEHELWEEVNDKLLQSESILDLLRNYNGATVEIREAISNFSDNDRQQRAWDCVLPLVTKLKQCYSFGLEIAEIVPKLLSALCSEEMTVNEHLEKQQALFKQFAEILDFVLKFDDMKMMNPSIQNDFSFYRRSCSRRRNDPSGKSGADSDICIREEFASKMSMFYAEATPMLKIISKFTSQWMAEEKTIPLELTTECLSSMAHICRELVCKPSLRSRFQHDGTLMLCLRVMTSVIILYDHIDPEGVFKRHHKVDVKSCIRLLKEQPAEKVECLLNALRFSTLHFNDVSTPRATKQLLMT